MAVKKILPVPLRNLYRKLFWLKHNHQHIELFNRVKEAYFSGPLTYHTDNLVTCNNADFIKDPRFARAYEAAAATRPWPNFTLQWRVYIVCWFANQVKHLDGDYVECGVNTGAYAQAVMEYIPFQELDKLFYLFDTFDGFVTEQLSPEERAAGLEKYDSAYRNVYEEVLKTFSNKPVKIIKGRVPQTLSHFASEKVAFLSIDMNAKAPEIAAAEFFWPRLVNGGVIILDDYGFPGHLQQKLAFDNFASERGVNVLSLPTGQGVIIK